MAHGVFRLAKMLDRLDGRVITVRGRKTRAVPDRRNTEDIAAEVALILLDQHLRRGHR